jgi:precorrin-8X/cobalt-precorrin-8 methylmutase
LAKTGIVVLAHGSRGERSEVPAILNRITEGLQRYLSAETSITGASLQFNHPNLDEAAEILINQGIRQIIISPYFLFTGRHLTEDIPENIANLKRQHPDVQFSMTANLGLQESFIELMAGNIIKACPDLSPDTSGSPIAADKIEEQSLKIVDRLLSAELTGKERTVAMRVVHAGGDPSLANLIRFSQLAIEQGIAALKKGAPIYTDVRMVSTGISKRLIEGFGGSVICALDEYPAETNIQQKTTRAAAAMHHLDSKLNSTIIAIGNAPTALLAVIDMIDHRNLKPALVIGMPVGFVQARESKAELMKRSPGSSHGECNIKAGQWDIN